MKRLTNIIRGATDTMIELMLIYLVIILFASITFSIFEHKNLIDSVWWSFVTAMTVGYGDTYPVTAGGRVVCVLLMHVVPMFIVPLITARVASKLIVDNNAFDNSEQEEIKGNIRMILKRLDDKN